MATCGLSGSNRMRSSSQMRACAYDAGPAKNTFLISSASAECFTNICRNDMVATHALCFEAASFSEVNYSMERTVITHDAQVLARMSSLNGSLQSARKMIFYH